MSSTIHLTVPKRIKKQFVAAAKQLFPLEAFAYLIGTVAGSSVYIDDLYIPDDITQFATERYVAPQPHWKLEAKEQAAESDLILVGDLHSHPYHWNKYLGLATDHSPSEGDLDYPTPLLITGICIVQEVKSKKPHLRASMRFWGPVLKVIEKET